MPRGEGETPRHEDFVRALGPDVAPVLFDWAGKHGTELLWPGRLMNGRSGARVVVVTEQPEGRSPRKLVVKVCPPEDDDAEDLHEPGRHGMALRTNPAFARKHLVGFAYEPLHVGGGVWVVFQELAGGSLDDTPPLAMLVDSVADRRRRRLALTPVCDGTKLASICRPIVRSVLDDWGPGDGQLADVVTYLGWQLGQRHQPGGSVHRWVEAHGRDLLRQWQRSAGSRVGRLPDPVALATDPTLTRGRKMWALLGPAHGDLQPENILLPMTRRQVRESGYRLIDLSRFAPDAPLARDPMHLLLSIVARHLGRIASPDERDALIRLLVDPDSPSSADHVPTWIHKVTLAITSARPKWVEKSFQPEWREQTALSLLACALVFTGRRTTPDPEREWFFRLAVAAAHTYLNRDREGAMEALWP
jgi:hypothetical protein